MPSVQVLEQKKQVVADLVERLNGSCAGVIVDYKGINVEDDTKLRKELRENGVEPEDIELVVNTHCHFDHIGGNHFFHSFVPFSASYSLPLPIFTSIAFVR